MKMIDALYPDAIPAGTTCDIIAAYIDHDANPGSFDQAVARFPGAVHLKISVRCTVGADVLDVEPGTGVTPEQAVTWVVESRKAGKDPTVYCNQQDPSWGWPACRAAFAAAGVPEPHWWIANYDNDPTIPAGANAKQYTDRDLSGRNTYDSSSTVPGWPNVQPTKELVASPTPPVQGEDDMYTLYQVAAGTVNAGRVYAVRPGSKPIWLSPGDLATLQRFRQLANPGKPEAILQVELDRLAVATEKGKL